MTEELGRQYLVVKRLQKTDLGWFEGPRRRIEDDGAGHQRSIGFHSDVIKRFIPPQLLLDGQVVLHEYYCDGETVLGPHRRMLSRQHKNWRLAGDMVKGKRFDSLDVGDLLLMLFQMHASGKWILAWDAVKRSDTGLTSIRLLEHLDVLLGDQAMRLVEEPDATRILGYWYRIARGLLSRFDSVLGNESRPSGADRKIESRVTGNLMDLYIRHVASLSPDDQKEFARKLSDLATVFRQLLEGDILRVERDHQGVWSNVKGHRLAFIDGGTASITALGTEPLAIRVGTYTVVPGDQSVAREHFEMNPQLVDQLFGPDGPTRVFDDDPTEDEVRKVRDVARVGLETAAAVKALQNHDDLRALFLHGPLVNPVSPYADVPRFTRHALAIMGLAAEEVRTFFESSFPLAEADEGHFIATYRYLLEKLFSSAKPVVGVIERSGMSRAISAEIIRQRRGTSRKLLDAVSEDMKQYNISDAMLFAAVLQEGEYIRPLEIDKNDLRRASPLWRSVIEHFPKPWTTYMMLRDTALPVRIEVTPQGLKESMLFPLIYHMSLLLPLYAFPVGLDVVDKYAKVPAWMSRQLSRHQASMLLRQALASGDVKLYNQVRLMLTQNAREWFLRPKHSGL